MQGVNTWQTNRMTCGASSTNQKYKDLFVWYRNSLNNIYLFNQEKYVCLAQQHLEELIRVISLATDSLLQGVDVGGDAP